LGQSSLLDCFSILSLFLATLRKIIYARAQGKVDFEIVFTLFTKATGAFQKWMWVVITALAQGFDWGICVDLHGTSGFFLNSLFLFFKPLSGCTFCSVP